MPDPIVMAKAAGLAMLVAAAVLGVACWIGRRAGAGWIDAGWVVGIAAGYYLGARMLEIVPRWPIREDLDRLLGLVLPAVLLVELLGAVSRVPRSVIWAMRMAVAALGARVLLHGSIYLSGQGPSSWSPSREWLTFVAIAAAEAATWIVLARLSRRPSGASVTIALAVAIGAASVTIMLSAYLAGGQAGLPMSSALMGASLVALAFPDAARSVAPIGIAVVGLGSLLVIGHFFGELRTDHAVLLMAAPWLAWIPEIPQLRRLPSWGRGMLRVVLVGLVVSGVLADAARRFASQSGPAAGVESSVDDYMKSGH